MSKNNVEFVKDLMEWSECGALIQPFVLEALWDYSVRVLENPPPNNGFLNGDAWVACAEEILEKLERRHATEN